MLKVPKAEPIYLRVSFHVVHPLDYSVNKDKIFNCRANMVG